MARDHVAGLYRWIITGLQALALAGVVAAVLLGSSFAYLPEEYRTQVVFCAAITLVGVFTTHLLDGSVPRTVTLAAAFLLWYLVAYPEAQTIYGQVFGALALLLGAWTATPTGVAVATTGAWIVASVSLSSGGIVWGSLVAERSAVAYLASIAIPLVSVTLLWTLRESSRRAHLVQSNNRQLSRAVEHLTSANVGFQEMVKSLAERTKQEERDRITRDIHDSIGYTVSNVIVMLDAAAGLVHSDPDKAAEIMVAAREQANRGHAETRRTLHILRALEEAEIFGIRNLARIAALFTEATGAKVEVDFGNIRPRYDGMIESAIYRFVQEGMTNSFRHGNATHIAISMFQGDGRLVVTVEDNGVGAPQISEGIGIVGMRERMSQVGGEINFENGKRGFRVTARIPLTERDPGISVTV